MKKLFLFLLVVVLALPAAASHILGGTITYTHLSAKKYKFHIYAWRDCDGIQMSQSNLQLYGDTGYVGQISSQTRKYQKDISLADTSSVCGALNRCISGTGGVLGVEEIMWECTIDFAIYGSSNCSFLISWEQASRSGSITTGQANESFYMQSYINLCYDSLPREIWKHNSPSFTLIHNYDFQYNPDFRDRYDYFDSISYTPTYAMRGYNTQATYGGSFAPTRPLTYFGFPGNNLAWPTGFKLNPALGNIEFRPTQSNQMAVISYKVEGWKKYNDTMRLVGWVQEEFDPLISPNTGIASPNLHVTRYPDPVKICANTTQCMEILVRGPHSSDTLFATWTRDTSAITVDTLLWTPDSILFRFCFSPDTSFIRGRPYVFGVNAWGNACPLIKTRSLKYGFIVTTPMDSSVTPAWGVERSCNHVRLSAWDSAGAGYPVLLSLDGETFPGDTIDLDLQDSGWLHFYIKQGQNGCEWLHADSVHIDSLYHFSTKVHPPYKPCLGSEVTLHPSNSGGLGYQTYLWFDSSTADSFRFSISNDTTFWLHSRDSSGCLSADTFRVIMNPPISINTQSILICTELPQTAVSLMASVNGGTQPYQYDWIGVGNTNSYSYVPPIHDTAIYLEITDSVGCISSDSLVIDRYIPHYPMSINDTTGCFLGALYLKPFNKMTTGSYQWLGMGAGDSIRYQPPLGVQVKVLRYTDSLGCQTYDSVRITNHAIPNFSLPPDTIVCTGSGLQIAASIYFAKEPITYNWYPYTQVTDSFVQDNFYQSARIKLELTDSSGCSRIDSMEVIVNTIPQIAAVSPLTVCTADSMTSLTGLSGSIPGVWTGTGVVYSGSGYWWDSRTRNPGVYSLKFEAQNASGNCTASESLTIDLRPSPTVDAGPDTGLCGGGLITLQAIGSGGSGGYSYMWNGDTTQKRDTFSVNSVIDSIHQVLLMDSNTCMATDSVRVFPKHIPESVILTPSSDTAICEGGTVHILADSLRNGIDHSYEFSDGFVNGLTILPNSSFTLLLRVESSEACMDSTSVRITVNENPEISGIQAGEFCEDFGPVYLDTFAVPANGIWIGPDVSFDSFSFVFDAHSGNIGSNRLYYVLEDSTTGCSVIDSVWMKVEEKTVVDFMADSTHGTGSMNAQFTDLSSGGIRMKYLWYFGDGDSSSDQAPHHFYSNPGTYTVSLWVSGDKCFSDTVKQNYIQVDSIKGPGVGITSVNSSKTQIYPNPSNRSFMVYGLPAGAFTKVNDANGKEIEVGITYVNQELLELDFYGKPPAVYFLSITTGERVVHHRLILE